MRRTVRILASALVPAVVAAFAQPVESRITKVEISSRAPAYGGQSFGSVGPYETLRGIAYGEVDPNDPLNEVITDIKLAPRNARGMVEYNMDFWISKPVNMANANGTLLHDVPNRGRVRSLEINVGGSGDNNAGDGFLQRQGFVLADNGWQGDVSTGLQIRLPIARNRNGSDITGRVRAEYILDTPASTVDVTTPPAYEAVSTSNSDAVLTRRVHQNDPREVIPNNQWAFADCSSTPFPGVPSTKKVCLSGNFDTNHIYELLYTAKNPMVLGLGFAATRDFISFLRNSNGASTGKCSRKGLNEVISALFEDDDSWLSGLFRRWAPCPAPAGSSPENPLGNSIRNAIIYGSSQSGRWIRSFIHLGFNQDENRNLVVEGAIPHKASNRGAFNVRFGQPDRLSGTQHTEQQYPGAESPQTWGVYNDRISDVRAGQLDRCRKTDSCPKIFHTNTDTEYWQALMALNTTDSEGRRDLRIPRNVRIYLFSGTRHGGGDVLAQPPAVLPPPPNACQLRNNSNPFIHGQRALLLALQDWIVRGTEPPPNLYPRLEDGTLVALSHIHYPYIPAVNFTLQGVTNQKFYLDRGPAFDVEDISGVMREPPVRKGEYAVRQPQVDQDGNTIAGLPSTAMLVPLGTYLGWNVRKAGFSEGDSCDLNGAFVPFFRTLAERQAAGDPRPSLQERYPNHADYVAKVTAAAESLVNRRLLLPDDAAFLIKQAGAAAVP